MTMVKEYNDAEKFLNEEFGHYVPASGKCETLYGEIIRAIAKLSHRNLNDGDHLGVGYGKETCNPAGRFLLASIKDDEIAEKLSNAWGEEDDDRYTYVLEKIAIDIAEYLKANKEQLLLESTEDMLSFFDPEEDRDDEDDYDDEWDEDDEW